jgi:hypothetical protein
MQNPDLIILYHETQERLDRQQAAHTHHVPAPGPLSTARAIAGNALIALGTRIAPASRPAITTPIRPTLAAGR